MKENLMNFMLKKKKFENSKFKISYDMLKKSSKFKQFNPRTLPGRVESTSLFNFVHGPGEVRIYLTRIKPPKNSGMVSDRKK